MFGLKNIILLILLAMLFGGCIRYYKYTNRNSRIVQSNYSLSDTVFVKDFILCNSLRNINKNIFSPKGGDMIAINEDSVLVHFKDSFQRLTIPVQFHTGSVNHCDSSFHRNVLVKDKITNHNTIKEISKKANERVVLVPLIYLDNVYENQMYFHSSGVAAGGDLIRNSYLNLAIYIINDGSIVYFKSGMHITISRHEDFEEEPKRQTQENWDKLVEMVMADYTQRAK